MITLTPGHKYELANFEDNSVPGQTLQFIEKTPIEGSPDLQTTYDGTTNEEVLKMLIDRMGHLQAKFPCKENAVAITHIETALLWLEKRTCDRKLRGVEGKQLA